MRRVRLSRLIASISCALLLTLASSLGCGSHRSDPFGAEDGGGTGDDAFAGFGAPPSANGSGGGGGSSVFSTNGTGAPAPSCQNGTGWSCAVNTSCGGTPTTLTGKVYDPAGTNPLYNAVVFMQGRDTARAFTAPIWMDDN